MKKYQTFKQLKKKDGTSMIEVLVAFMIVMIMLSMFTKIVSVSANVLNRSRSTIARTENFNEMYYRTDKRSDRKIIADSFSLGLDTINTKSQNKAEDVRIELENVCLRQYTDDTNKIIRYLFDSNSIAGHNPEE